MKSNTNHRNSVMKTIPEIFWRSFTHYFGPALPCAVGMALSLNVTLQARAADSPRTFATPDDAVAALRTAAKNHDQAALRAIFGPELEDIENPDRVQATNDISDFAAAMNETFHITHESDSKCVLEVGSYSWPFAIPIVKHEGNWSFDMAAGRDELLNRRIGK